MNFKTFFLSATFGVFFIVSAPASRALDGGTEESAMREGNSGRKSDGGMRKVSSVPLPNGREAPPQASTRLMPGKKQLPSEPSTVFPARSLFLNGVNIGSVREQELENVTVKIDGEGNIHLFAPHYDVHEDTTYHPLLPQELPRFPKAGTTPEGLPRGPFSKSVGENARRAENEPFEKGGRESQDSRDARETKDPKESKDAKPNKDGTPSGFMPVGKPQRDGPEKSSK